MTCSMRTLAGIVCACSTLAALAHDGDGKIFDRQPPVQAAAYRAAVDGPDARNRGFAASGVSLLSWLPLNTFGSGVQSGADCWGYVSPAGREYAIMTHYSGASFVEVTDPANATLIGTIDGPDSLWRDAQVYQNYCYLVSEGGSGIQVVDLSQIDAGTVTFVRNVLTGGTTATHTVIVNEASGYLYRCGGADNGLRIYSLANPSNPTLVATWPDRYVHEAHIISYTEGPYAGKEIGFLCSGFNGGFDDTGLDIVDLTNKSNIVNLSRITWPNRGYSHQVWTSKDRQYVYVNDELDEGATVPFSSEIVIDVSDLSAPVYIGSPNNGNTAITHNLYVKDDLLIAANYRSGLRVFDISNPTDLVEIAYFDTYPNDDAPQFNGLWGNFPFFPSGTVIGSDLERGLFVWTLNLPKLRFSFPAGLPETISPQGASVDLEITGQFGGQVQAGTETLWYYAGGNWQSAALVLVGGSQYQAALPAAACGSTLSYYFSAQATTGEVLTSPADAPTSAHGALVASGFNVALLDELETNTGWATTAVGDNATTGIWTRVNPNGTAAQPEDDHTAASGVMCFVTGQGAAGGGVGDADVDGGRTTLTTPALDLSGLSAPWISYWRWYNNSAGASPNEDTLPIDISNDNGASWVNLETVGPIGAETAGGWYFREFRVSDFVAPTAQVKLRFVASDLGSGSIVEAAVDDLQVRELVCNACPADLNGDGSVDLDDLSVLLVHFGTIGGGTPAQGDLNGDGNIDLTDLSMLLTQFGTTCG